jgi:hypothetical protein
MITNNLRIDDGLVNGCVGTLRHMVMSNEVNNRSDANRLQKPLVKRIYLDCSYDLSIGKKTREKENKTNRQLDSVDLNSIWTIMECTRKRIPKVKARYHAERLQYPIVECESMTIHKSQGQTYERVVVDIGSSNLSRALIYVAVSRVTSLNGLTLVGARSILPPGYENKSFAERKIECDKRLALNNVQREMNRMRKHAPFKNYFTFLDPRPDENIANELNILCMNIQSLNANRSKIKRDFGFSNADIILLVECHNNLNYKLQASILFDKTHQMIHFSSYYDAKETNSSIGQICFIKRNKNLSIRFVANNCDRDLYLYTKKKNLVELSLFEYSNQSEQSQPTSSAQLSNKVYILCVYKHPDMKSADFLTQLSTFINKHVPNAFPTQSQNSTASTQRSNSQMDPNIFIFVFFTLFYNKVCLNFKIIFIF